MFQGWYSDGFGVGWLKITNELLPERFLAESLHSSEPQIWHPQSQDNHKDFHGEKYSDLLLKNTVGESCHIYCYYYYYYCHLLLLFLCSPTASVNSLHIDKFILRAQMTEMFVKFIVPNTSNFPPSAASYTQLWFEPSGWRAKLRLPSYPAVLVSVSIPLTPASWFNSSWSS